MYIDYLFHCQRLATRSKSTILIVLKCFQTEVCSGKTTIIFQLEGSGMLKKKCKDLHSDTSLHLHCNDVHEQTMGQTFYCIIRINSILYTLYNTNCA